MNTLNLNQLFFVEFKDASEIRDAIHAIFVPHDIKLTGIKERFYLNDYSMVKYVC